MSWKLRFHCWHIQSLSLLELTALAENLPDIAQLEPSAKLAETANRQRSLLRVREQTNLAMHTHLCITPPNRFFLPEGMSSEVFERASWAVGYAGLGLVTEGAIPPEDTECLLSTWQQVIKPRYIVLAV